MTEAEEEQYWADAVSGKDLIAVGSSESPLSMEQQNKSGSMLLLSCLHAKAH